MNTFREIKYYGCPYMQWPIHTRKDRQTAGGGGFGCSSWLTSHRVTNFQTILCWYNASHTSGRKNFYVVANICHQILFYT